MGFKDLWDKITGNAGPKLTQATGDVPVLEVSFLEVSTAEALVIIELSPADVAKVLDIAMSKKPSSLRANDTTVTFVPTDRDVLPVKDPKKGWIIPLPSSVTSMLRDSPGDYEINNQIAFVVAQ